MEAANGRCAKCGTVLPGPDEQCPACEESSSLTSRPTKGVFFILILLLVISVGVTGVIARGYERRQTQLALRWFDRGNNDLLNGNPAKAVDEFQTALAFNRNNDAYRLKLALALMQSGREEEARVHLVNLWEAQPGDSNVNLLLARVMARLGHSQDAIRYYHGAIYGVWDSDPLEKRQAARFELANYLLNTRQYTAAESELIALMSEAPANSQSQIKLGDMFMDAGDPGRALSAYQHARGGDRNDANANLGAARAAFALHRFRDARTYARDALRNNPKSEDATAIADQAEALLKADPFAPGIGAKQRAQRAYDGFSSANERLKLCAGESDDATLQQLGTDRDTQLKRVTVRGLLQDPDYLQQTVQWVYDVESATESTCGAPTGLDATLLMLARFQGGH